MSTDRHEVGAPDDGPRAPGPSGTGQVPDQVPQDEPRRGRVPYEAQVFGRMAAFGLVVGAVYWFLTYEAAGSVLLFTFGIASTIAGVAIFLGSRRRGSSIDADEGALASATLDAEPVPGPGWAPILIGVGLGAVALGAAFGPWLAIAGVLVTVRSALVWLETAVDETRRSRTTVPRDERFSR